MSEQRAAYDVKTQPIISGELLAEIEQKIIDVMQHGNGSVKVTIINRKVARIWIEEGFNVVGDHLTA